MFYPTVGHSEERFFKVRDGAARRAHCSACGVEAEEKHGRFGIQLRCPNRERGWHVTAQVIAREMEQTENSLIRELLLDDLMRFLGEHGVVYGAVDLTPTPLRYGEGCRDRHGDKQTQAARGDRRGDRISQNPKLASYEHIWKAPENYVVLALPDSKFEYVIMRRSDLGDVLVEDLQTYALVAQELIRAGVEVINYLQFSELRSRGGNKHMQTSD